MKQYRFTPAAASDLDSIWEYTANRWDIQQAVTYVTEIRYAVERVADDPSRGRSCDEIRHGYRRYAIGSHVIFYVETLETVDVIRILHQRMDFTRHF